jgi:glycosyltransferase involved in cell wall biosynthesis
MDLSILVPTYNRPDFLIRLLRSLEATKPCDLEWELLVVDNNSAPDRFTAIEAAIAASSLPARLLSEPTPGKSRALNTAIRAARGRVVAFLDHDVSVHPGYLVGIQDVLRGASPCRVFGGRVLAPWTSEAPDWIRERGPLSTSFGPIVIHDYGDVPREYDETMRRPVGCNFLCERALFERHGYFDVKLGPGAAPGLETMGGEESELLKRFQTGGECIRYAPHIVVDHPVDPARTTRAAFRRRYFVSGRSQPYFARRKYPSLFGIPRFLFRRLAGAVGGTVWARLRGDGMRALDHELDVCRFIGAMYEFRRVHRAGRRTEAR